MNTYTKIINFPRFKKDIEIENDIEETTNEKAVSMTTEDANEDKASIIDDDDVPNLFL